MFRGGAVRVQSDYYSGGRGPGHWEFRILVDGFSLGTFIARRYGHAWNTATMLAEFLGMELVDETDEESRRWIG